MLALRSGTQAEGDTVTDSQNESVEDNQTL